MRVQIKLLLLELIKKKCTSSESAYKSMQMLVILHTALFYAISNKPVSQSYVVAKPEKFWWATGQSNMADKWLAATKASKVWFSYSHSCTLANGAVFHSVCQV